MLYYEAQSASSHFVRKSVRPLNSERGIEMQSSTSASTQGGGDDGWPLVSIVTPTYNQSSFLRETIESVLEQDYPRIEHIVIDDGSTYDTPAVLSEYVGRV